MSAGNSFHRYWLPVLAVSALIFTGSTDLLSTEHTSRIIEPIVRWIKPDISDATMRRIVTVVRKAGHVSEYALLTALIWRALRKPVRNDQRPWSRREAIASILIAAAYAGTDEWHQSFVSTRFASAFDVLIDTIGAATCVLVIWSIGRLRRRW